MNFPRSLLLIILFLSVNFVFANELLELSLITKSISLSKKNEGTVKVRLTNEEGKFATKAKVFLVKAYPSNQEDNVLVSNQELFPVEGEDTAYQFNFLALKPEAGSYILEFRATPEKKEKFRAIDNVVFTVKVIGIATVADAQLTVSDSLDSQDIAEGRKYRPEFDKKIDEIIKVEHSQHLIFELRLKGQTGKNIQVQQVFVRISHPKSGREVFKVAQLTKTYSTHITIKDIAEDFYGQSGNYDLQLIIGDAFLQNPSAWTFASLHINFLNSSRSSPPSSPFDPQPPILHQFRVPDKRPPKTISMAFTGAVIGIPFLILFVGLIQVGANLGNLPTNTHLLFALGFQGCLGGVLVLFVVYWLRLTMVETLCWLLVISGPLLFFAHRNLNALSATRKEHSD